MHNVSRILFNIYFFGLIRNNAARWARVDRLRCHDEAFLTATAMLGSVKRASTRSRRKSRNRTRWDRVVQFRGRRKDVHAEIWTREREDRA